MSTGSDPAAETVVLARHLYEALASGDAESLRQLLHSSFTGRAAEGLPLGLGGDYDSPETMIQDFWWAIGRHYRARAEPGQFLPLADGGLLVLGRYTGTARDGGGRLDASFAHVLQFTDGQISELAQYTDTARWAGALPPTAAGQRDLRVVGYDVNQGVATIRLNRPEAGNAIDLTLVEDFYEACGRAAEDPAVRAVLLCGAGRSLSTGGDLTTFAGLDPGQLSRRLRQMIDLYHLALDRLTRIDPPVVCAVRGAAAGGGLGLLHVSDVVIAAEDSKFALGYSAIGLASDGANTWFLPRLVGLRRAQELILLNRRLTAPEALDWGLVTEIVPAADVEKRALELAQQLAVGPTQAFGRIKRLLRDSWTTDLPGQLSAETTQMSEAGASDDAVEGIAAYLAKRPPTFRGR
ncbi:MAG TPA: enoyl-CoA hydratase-related protein [Streptosporangiaceae bacterium]|jgi:2-(1,2-epoxy-1,2-dihydrophenyl)acetyl-CoA isomerase